MWCNEGVESIVPITKYEEEQRHGLFETIKSGNTPKCELGHIVNYMMLRSRFNPQRYYEIYAIDCDETITKEDLEESFDLNPNNMAKLIRSRGVCIHGEPMTKSKIRIF